MNFVHDRGPSHYSGISMIKGQDIMCCTNTIPNSEYRVYFPLDQGHIQLAREHYRSPVLTKKMLGKWDDGIHSIPMIPTSFSHVFTMYPLKDIAVHLM